MSAKPLPPRIMAVLRELADRGGNEFAGPAEDRNGEALQDDADEAISWIESLEASPPSAKPLTQDQRDWLLFARSLVQMAGELPVAASTTEAGG